MADKELFLDTLREVAEIARVSEKPVGKDEIRRYFSEMDLSEEQEEMIYQYLKSVPEQDADKGGEDDALNAQEPGKNGKDTVADALEMDKDEEDAAANALEMGKDEEDAAADTSKPDKDEEDGTADASKESMSESAGYQMYLNEVVEKKAHSKEKMQELYCQLIEGENVTSQIVDGWLMRVIRLAEQYEDSHVNMQDLIQEGNMALWLALQNIDGKMNPADVDRYLQESVKEAFEDYIREVAGVSDQTQAMLSKAALLHEAQEFLALENGQTPSMRELSAYTHISVDEIQSILALYENPGKRK